MADPVGALRVDLSASSAKFQADMKKAKNAVQTNATGMSAAMSKVGAKFTAAATALNRYAGLAALAAAGAMAVFIKKQIDIADQMGKLAQTTGTTSEYLSSMALVASQGGTTLEAVAKGIKKLSQNMDDVRRGIGEALEAFEELNIKVIDNAGVLRKSDQVMLDIADRFRGMEDGAEKTAYAMAIFGRAGGELIPMLNGGREGIEQLQKKAEEMGLVISTKTALEAAYLNDQLDILMKTVQGTGRGIALDLIPWLNETMMVMALAKEEAGTLMAAWVGLGAVGSALFTKSLQQKINDTTEKLKQLRDVSKGREGAFFKRDKVAFDLVDAEITKYEQKLAGLEAQKAAEEKSDQDRMKASAKRLQDEAEERRKNTEAVREQAQAKIDAAMAAKTAAAKAKTAEDEAKAAQEARWAADIATDEAIIQMMADIEEGTRLSINSFKDLTDAQKKINDLTDEGKRLTKSLLTPTEQYAATIGYLDTLLKAGAISQETYNRGIEKAKEDLDDLADTVEDKTSIMNQAFAGWGNSFSSTLNDMLWGSEATFSDIAESFAKMVTQMMIQKYAIEKMFGDGSGGSGWFGVALKAVGAVAGAGSAASNAGFGSLGGMYANGGYASPGKMYEVNENNTPELLSIGNRQFLMMAGQPGMVTPVTDGGGSSGSGRERTASGDLGVTSSGEGAGTTIIINAVDSKSFAEVVKRNPGSIVTVINDALQNRTGLLDTIRGTL